MAAQSAKSVMKNVAAPLPCADAAAIGGELEAEETDALDTAADAAAGAAEGGAEIVALARVGAGEAAAAAATFPAEAAAGAAAFPAVTATGAIFAGVGEAELTTGCVAGDCAAADAVADFICDSPAQPARMHERPTATTVATKEPFDMMNFPSMRKVGRKPNHANLHC
jgi:hypothetical protein